MSKILKYSLGIISILILILLMIPFFISLETYKDIIISEVNKHTGRKLTIEGEIAFNFLPSPEVRISNIALSSISDATKKYLFQSKSVSGKLSLKPLLRGQIEISKIEIDKPIINLEKLPNGRVNWEFKKIISNDVKKNSAKEDIGEEYSKLEGNLPLIINQIKVRNAILNYIEPQNMSSVENFDIDFSIRDIQNLHTSQSKTPKTHSQNNNLWSKEIIDLGMLKFFNGDLSFNAKKIIHNDLICHNLNIIAQLNDGILKVNSFDGEIYQGKFNGNASISSTNNQKMHLNLNLKDIHLHNIMPSNNLIKLTKAIINTSLELESFGTSQFSYIQNMKGNIEVQGAKGIITGIDITQLIDSVRKPKNIEILALGLSRAIGRGQTEFTNLYAKGEIDQGIVQLSQGEVASESASAKIHGTFNLRDLSMDIASIIDVAIKDIPQVKINFYGSMKDPNYKIDVKSIWKHLIKNTLTDAIDDIQQGKINPENLLKGLFK